MALTGSSVCVIRKVPPVSDEQCVFYYHWIIAVLVLFLLAHVQMYKRQDNVCEWYAADFGNGGKPESNIEKLTFSQFYAN